MSPPRLTLVSSTERVTNDQSGIDAAQGGDLARVISEVEAAAQGFVGVHHDHREKLRQVEALLFASPEPLTEAHLAAEVGAGAEIGELLAELQESYTGRGVNLVRVAEKWAFRTASDLSHLLTKHATEERRLSKAALETLAIISYHQPVTRAEIEEIRGVVTSAGTLDILMEAGWVRPRGRRRAPGKPLTYGTTENFLAYFGLESIKDLPGLSDLKSAGLLDGNLPPGFVVPTPQAVAALMPDELPLEAGDDGREEEDGEGDDEAEVGDADGRVAPEGPLTDSSGEGGE